MTTGLVKPRATSVSGGWAVAEQASSETSRAAARVVVRVVLMPSRLEDAKVRHVHLVDMRAVRPPAWRDGAPPAAPGSRRAHAARRRAARRPRLSRGGRASARRSPRAPLAAGRSEE